MRQGQQPFSRHAGFFAALQRVEDRLASEEQRQEEKKSPLPPPPPPPASATTRQPEPSPFSDTMTASPLLFLDPAPISAADRGSSGPALDFLTEQDQQPIQQDDDDEDHDSGGEEDIARLMALLGLSPPPTPTPDGDSSRDGDGCGCSGADGFMAKVVGVVGPKCDGEKRRLGAWIRHYHRGEGEGGGGCREPARLAHLLLARASCDTGAAAFPATVREFLGRDPPQHLADDELE